MNELITNNIFQLKDGRNVFIRKLNGKRVVSLSLIDTIHSKPKGSASRNFNEHKKDFVLNEDYYLFWRTKGRDMLLDGRYNKPEDIPDSNNFLFYLFTYKGYIALSSYFQDKSSYDIRKQMLDKYFQIAEYKPVEISLPSVLKLLAEHIEKQNQRLNKLESSMAISQKDSEAKDQYLYEKSNELAAKTDELKAQMETPIAEGALTPAQLAEKMEMFSLQGYPHADAIADICKVLGFDIHTRILVPETGYLQYRVETKGNIQIIQAYLKPLLQKLVIDWWKENKESVKHQEYYKINTKDHMKGDPKQPYYVIYKLRRVIA